MAMFLVTGGAGFIGSHTVAALRERGLRVRLLDDFSTGKVENLAGLDAEVVRGSITDRDAVARAVDGCSHVVHLAALTSVPASCADPLAFDAVNARGTVIVFEASRRAGVKRVVYASSAAVYGASEVVPKHESMPLDPQSPYAATKAVSEAYGRTYSASLGLECVGLRYFNVFGPRQDPNGPYAAAIPKFVEFALRGEVLPIFGDGEQGRDFVAVADVARANIAAAQAPGIAGRVYNVGGGRMTTINALADYVLGVVGGSSKKACFPKRPGDLKFSVADISAIQRDLGWEPEADFHVAMRDTIAWYAGTIAG